MTALLHKSGWKQGRGVLTALFVLSAFSGPALAQDDPATRLDIGLDGDLYPGLEAPAGFSPYVPVVRDALPMPFDLGGSDERRLRLELDQPIDVRSFGVRQSMPGGGSRLVTGTAMNVRAGDRLSLGGGVSLGESDPDFQSLGRIHCENGTLNALSYTASNCHFVDNPATFRSGTAAIGSRFRLTDNSAASARLFQSRSDLDLTGQSGRPVAAAIDPMQLGLAGDDGLFPNVNALLGAQRFDSELTGVDLEFQVGISTDSAGDMVLGLQLTRILDSQAEGVWFDSPGIHNWTIAEPFNTAGVSFDWSRGAFSGGVQSYYRAPVEFMNRQPLDSQATFDVHFTWRAPWNASFSVGASNVLDAGTDEPATSESSLVDPFESIYGRIPYVRYKQDL